jgi:hypothetical protein
MNDELENYSSKQNNQYMGQNYATSGVSATSVLTLRMQAA